MNHLRETRPKLRAAAPIAYRLAAVGRVGGDSSWCGSDKSVLLLVRAKLMNSHTCTS